MTYLTQADVFRPTLKKNVWWYNLALILSGSLFVALFAQIALPLPFSPVPITGQTLAVLMIGALYGSWRGGLTLLVYLAEGAVGLPVFAEWRGGLAVIFGPTGGYLLGFVVAAFVVGLLAEKGWDRRIVPTLIAMFLGNTIIYLCGLPWLAWFVGFENVLTFGLYPYIPGDIAKLIVAALLLPGGWQLLGLTGKLNGLQQPES